MNPVFIPLIIALIIQTLLFVIATDQGYKNALTPLFLILFLPQHLFMIPLGIIILLMKTEIAQKFVKFLITPIPDLINFKIKFERK